MVVDHAMDADITGLVQEQLRFQHRWQVISMSAYVVSTIGTLLCTSIASLLAAAGYQESAAVLAASGTVLISIEKSLLFREKWRLHLSVYTRFKLLQADIISKQIDIPAATKRFAEILDGYATGLPIGSRDQ